MQLLKNLGTRLSKTEKSYQSWGLFKCPECLNAVERQLGHGLKQKSCGCIKNRLISDSLIGEKRNYKHGESDSRLYTIWVNMKQRCYNPKTDSYDSYGGRGILVCDEWKNSSEIFILWALNNGYQEGLQIDRRNTDGNYEPKNCRFVTAKENANNRRSNIPVEIVNEICSLYNSGYYTQKELAEKYSLSQPYISYIINKKLKNKC